MPRTAELRYLASMSESLIRREIEAICAELATRPVRRLPFGALVIGAHLICSGCVYEYGAPDPVPIDGGGGAGGTGGAVAGGSGGTGGQDAGDAGPQVAYGVPFDGG